MSLRGYRGENFIELPKHHAEELRQEAVNTCQNGEKKPKLC